jgi:hypothetical protein
MFEVETTGREVAAIYENLLELAESSIGLPRHLAAVQSDAAHALPVSAHRSMK